MEQNKAYLAQKRRILACDACRRVKGRCDYDSQSGICRRCQRLRIACSIKKSSPEGNTANDKSAGLDEIRNRLTDHDAILEDIRTEVQKVSLQLQANRNTPLSRPDDPTESENTGDGWYDQKDNAADTSASLAPVNVVRQKYPVHSGIPRLLEISMDDIVTLGLLSEQHALEFEQAFLARVGAWIQVDDWKCVAGESTIRQKSPFLFAVCCLQGGRLDESFCNSAEHEALYEHVRKLMQRLFLISPLPVESILAFLIMGIWSTGPRGTSEFTDSWLLSSYTAQQAILNIHFAEIMKRLQCGKAGTNDKFSLRLWNDICLCHLQFAIGTGRPSTIKHSYLEQGRSILNTFDASIYDGFNIGAMEVLSLTEGLITRQVFSRYQYITKKLEKWKRQWNHLFESDDHRLCTIRIVFSFCSLVLAHRALEEHNSDDDDQITSPMQVTNTSPSVVSGTPRYTEDDLVESWTAMSRASAIETLQTFRSLPVTIVQELPEFLYLCIVYAMFVLAQFAKAQPSDENLRKILQETLVYGQRATSKTWASFDLTVTALEDLLDPHTVTMEGIEEAMEQWNLPELEEIFNGIFATKMLYSHQSD